MRNLYKILIATIIAILTITAPTAVSLPSHGPLAPAGARAQSAPTSTPKPEITTEQKEIDTIEKIKDLVASKVAELKLVEKRGILTVVKRSSNSQIAAEDHKRNQRTIDIDELTKFVSRKSSFGISDILEGNRISALGLYSKDTKRLLARFITISDNVPQDIEGIVTLKNTREFSLTVADSDGKTKTIDVETSTKTSVWENDTLTKSGFTRILVGERIIVIGFTDLKAKDTINASRIIHFADLPLSKSLKKHLDIEEDSVSTRSAI